MKTNWPGKLILLLLAGMPAFAQTPWYTAYYGSWNQRPLGSATYVYEKLGQEPKDIDWTGITNIVHFGNGNTSTTPPYCTFAKDSTEITYGPEGNRKTDYQTLLISTAHANGVTVCLSIQAVDGSALKAVVADQAKIDVFADWIVQYCKRHDYDGVELDWETSLPTSAQMTSFIQTLRSTLDRYYAPRHALIVISPGLSDFRLYPPALDAAIDQYNVQLYALMWTPNDKNTSWHECAVYPGTSTNGVEGAIDGTTAGGPGNLQQWVTAGHSWSKMGMGLPTFGYIFTGVDGLFQTGYTMHGHNGGYSVDQNSLCTGLTRVGGTFAWDDVRKASTITGTATRAYTLPGGNLAAGQKFFSTVPNAQQAREWVKWGKAHNVGGYMLYSLTEDLDPSNPAGGGRNIIHDALRDALSGATLPPGAPTGTFDASPSTVASGDSVTLTWTSFNATSAAIAPGNLTVTPPESGSTRVRMTASTTFALTLTNASNQTTRYSASVTVSATMGAQDAGVTANFLLDQNYPNPFNPGTTISYYLPQHSAVQLSVFNVVGQRVATLVQEEQESGKHEIRFDAKNLSSGVYFYRLQAGSFIQTRKLQLLK